MLNLNHKKLEVWHESLELVKSIYEITSRLSSDEKFGLVSQLNRAATSVISNLSEGSARHSSIERKRFYEISRSSLVEIDAQIEILIKLKQIHINDLKNVEKRMNKVFAMLSNLIKSTK